METKRTVVKELIERYFFQLKTGCGNPKCLNNDCASSGNMPHLSPNDMAARAIQLFSRNAPICPLYIKEESDEEDMNDIASENHSARLIIDHSASNSTSSSHSSDSANGSLNSLNINMSEGAIHQEDEEIVDRVDEDPFALEDNEEGSIFTRRSSSSHALQSQPPSQQPHSYVSSILAENASTIDTSPSPQMLLYKSMQYMNEALVDAFLKESESEGSFINLLVALTDTYSNIGNLSRSFWRDNPYEELDIPEDPNLHEMIVRSSDSESDEEMTVVANSSTKLVQQVIDNAIDSKLNITNVDFSCLSRIRKKIFTLNKSIVTVALNESIIKLTQNILKIRFFSHAQYEKILHCLVICFEISMESEFPNSDYIENILPKICLAASVLPLKAKARLARIWAANCKDKLLIFVRNLQQFITWNALMEDEDAQENPQITAATEVLQIAYYASILSSKLEEDTNAVNRIWDEYEEVETDLDETDEENIFNFSYQVRERQKPLENLLQKELNISAISCSNPIVPYDEFYNESLSDVIQMDRDYLAYKNKTLYAENADHIFTFMMYSFILTPASKVIALYYDSRLRMYSERNSSFLEVINNLDNDGATPRPELRLSVHRDHLIRDSLIGLEMVAMSNPNDFKKQLYVEFMGEQGIDEGGVSKEFFQLITEEVLKPDFGMFFIQQDTGMLWFNSESYENQSQFTLIGIIIGLAIYNNIILSVNFPMVVYRKLLGVDGTFADMKDWNPTLYRSLKSLLDYEENDMADVFMQTFKISYTNIFGEAVEHELESGGSDLMVTQENKKYFVDLYSDFMLNQSIKAQFRAFKKGFDMVTDESPLKLLFRPEEIEQLVCGDKNYDFTELQDSTTYDGGFTEKTKTVQDFWTIVHEMSDREKRKLLEFTTGSDRCPAGGLSHLKLCITRAGADSDRLPTAHTCYNVLLLPEYNSKKKLKKLLLKAITYSKGFGML